jgi:hypothetical protein
MLGPADAADGAHECVDDHRALLAIAFAADPGVSGRTMQLAARRGRIAGVWPDGARLIMRAESARTGSCVQAEGGTLGRFTQLRVSQLARGADLVAAEGELFALMPASPDRGPTGEERPAITPPTVFLGGRLRQRCLAGVRGLDRAAARDRGQRRPFTRGDAPARAASKLGVASRSAARCCASRA